MSKPLLASVGIGLVLGLGLWCWQPGAEGQQSEAPPPAEGPPPVPQGIEVQARGPIHEAFANPTSEPQATPVVPKRPPAPLDEMPPEERPEGDVVWIAGYWAWDDDRSDFLWVSGCWRQKPPGKEWVPGYWREQEPGAQWVPGFWNEAAVAGKAKEVTYYPAPPAPPQVAPPGQPPAADTFYTPGYYVWNGDRYAWRAGYWARVQPGYVWVAAHYRWTPSGYVWIPGYWDLAVARRGMLYAPVIVDPQVVTVGYVYTPAYAVPEAVMVDTLFVRPGYGCYYFGDYYGPRYVALGFESGVVYSRRHYDSIVVYECYHHRDDPHWLDVRVNLCFARDAGRAPLPPRTLAQQALVVRGPGVALMIAPAARVAAAGGLRTVRVDVQTRMAARQQAKQVQLAAIQQRRQAERPLPPGVRPTAPRTAALSVPPARAVAPQGGLAAAPRPNPATTAPAVKSGTTTPALHPTTPRGPTVRPGTSTTPPSGPYGSAGGPGRPGGYPPGYPASPYGPHPGNPTTQPGRDAFGRPLPGAFAPPNHPNPPPHPAPPSNNQKSSDNPQH